MSILELMVAIAILATVMAVAFEALGASTDQEALGAAQDELSEDSERIRRVFAEDLGRSGWHLADRLDVGSSVAGAGFSPGDAMIYDPSAGGWTHNGIYAAATPAVDRTLHYYPFVCQQAPPGVAVDPESWSAADPVVPAACAGLGAATASAAAARPNRYDWSHTHRSDRMRWPGRMPDEVAARLPGVPPTAPALGDLYEVGLPDDRDQISYHARSRELIFLRTTGGGWTADPEQQPIPASPFSGSLDAWRAAMQAAATSPGSVLDRQLRDSVGVLFQSGWEESTANPGMLTWRQDASGAPLAIYGAELSSAYLDTASTGNLLIRPKWEAMRAEADDPQENLHPGNLREYMYAVVPPPGQTGLGRLVRAYSAVIDGVVVRDRGEGSQPGQWISRSGRSGLDKAMIVDAVLSDNVTRIVFTTARHDASLEMNQVRVRIHLARAVGGHSGTVVHRVVETVLLLGTRNGNNDLAFDRDALPAVSFPR